MRAIKFIGCWLSSFGILLLLSGCSLFYQAGFEKDVSFRMPSPDEMHRVTKAVDRGREPFSSLRYRANLTLSGTLWKSRLRFSAVSQSPNNLRVELFTSGFPKLVTLLIVKEPQVVIYDAIEKNTYGAYDSEQAIRSLLGVPYDAANILYWGLGRVPELRDDFEVRVAKDFETSGLFVTRRKVGDSVFSSLGRIFRCQPSEAPQTFVAREVESLFVEKGKTIFSAQLAYGDECPDEPYEIKFSLGKQGVDGVLSQIQTSFNPDLSSTAQKLFSIDDFLSGEVLSLDKYQSQYQQNNERSTSAEH